MRAWARWRYRRGRLRPRRRRRPRVRTSAVGAPVVESVCGVGTQYERRRARLSPAPTPLRQAGLLGVSVRSSGDGGPSPKPLARFATPPPSPERAVELGAARVGQALSDAPRGRRQTRCVPAVASAVERAIYTAIENRLGLRARAVLRASLSAELEQKGANPELAGAVGALLDDCETTRFAASAEANMEPLVERGATVVTRLGRVVRPPEGRA